MNERRALWSGLVAALTVAVVMGMAGHSAEIQWTAGVVVVCAWWWVFEPIPIAVTSLVPLAIFPLVGILDADAVGASYGHPLVLLMMGGFMLSTAMELSNTHRRIALSMVRLFGGMGNRGLVFGFMLASATLSMWISNAATTLMLLPIALAVTQQVNDPVTRRAILLGVCYSASIGGVGTPVGTPPNLVFMSVYFKTTNVEPSFIQWMRWALPVVLVMLPAAALYLTRRVPRGEAAKLPEVGAWRPEEVRTLGVFALTALLWVTRKNPWGGWSELLGLTAANDACVALLAVIVMHIVPSGKEDGSKLLDWKSASSIPWGVLILYGGGIAIAKAFTASGLSDVIGSSLAGISTWPTIVVVGSICLAVTFLTELTSNTATATLLMPILAAVAVKIGLAPEVIMVPAAISCSFAFMLPVATPTNAIVFSSGEIPTRAMMREGFALNLLGVIIVTLLSLVLL